MRIASIFSMAVDPPPSDAECEAMSASDFALDVCRRLQDPAVWRSGHAPVPVPDELR